MAKTPSNDQTDTYYANKKPMLVDFVFDDKVAQVFPDMIRRSVPGYDNLITQMGIFSAQYAQDNSRLYDLGCSTGATSLSLAQTITAKNCTLIAIDNSTAMTQLANQNLQDLQGLQPHIICGDINDVQIDHASLITLNFTSQFIAKEKRLALLSRIFDGLLHKGVLILSEKITFSDTDVGDFHTTMHLGFKAANGYSDLEISQKRSALENVLIPDTLEDHLTRLKSAGFTVIIPWFQSFNFVSIFAQKTL